jgi:hypothetical protein
MNHLDRGRGERGVRWVPDGWFDPPDRGRQRQHPSHAGAEGHGGREGHQGPGAVTDEEQHRVVPGGVHQLGHAPGQRLEPTVGATTRRSGRCSCRVIGSFGEPSRSWAYRMVLMGAILLSEPPGK